MEERYQAEAAKLAIIRAMQENMFAHMLFFPERIDHFAVLKSQGLTMVNSGLADDTFNQVFNAKLREHPLAIIESTVDYFKRESLPFSWWLSPDDAPVELPELLAEAGLKLTAKNVGMYMPIADHAFEQAELRVERVLDATQLQDFATVVLDHMGHTEAAQTYYQWLSMFPFVQNDYEQLYVGYLDEEPVSVGILTLHSKVAGIHNVVTRPHQRRRGFGTAMMQELLMRAQMAEHSVAVLQAQKDAVNLYEQLGFEPICDFYEYALNPSKRKTWEEVLSTVNKR